MRQHSAIISPLVRVLYPPTVDRYWGVDTCYTHLLSTVIEVWVRVLYLPTIDRYWGVCTCVPLLRCGYVCYTHLLSTVTEVWVRVLYPSTIDRYWGVGTVNKVYLIWTLFEKAPLTDRHLDPVECSSCCDIPTRRLRILSPRCCRKDQDTCPSLRSPYDPLMLLLAPRDVASIARKPAIKLASIRSDKVWGNTNGSKSEIIINIIFGGLEKSKAYMTTAFFVESRQIVLWWRIRTLKAIFGWNNLSF